VAYIQAATVFQTRSQAEAYRSAEALARQAIALDGADAEAFDPRGSDVAAR
jgi:hypothetical protein